MPYLLDSNVFIHATHDHYRFAVCPGFWDWLLRANQSGIVFSIDKVRTELTTGNDALSTWAAGQSTAFFLPTNDSVSSALASAITWAASQTYEQQAIATFFAAADYWLVAHALTRSWALVTHERSHPDSKRRIMLPDACSGVGLRTINPFQLLEDEGARFVLEQ
jgi:hypothetical protein